MCAERRLIVGQALVEVLVAMLALVPLYFGIAWLAKVMDVRQATISAARSVAFECTVRIDACRDIDAHPTLAARTRRRFFAAHDQSVRSDEGAAGPTDRVDGNAFWTDRRGEPLLERYEDVRVSVRPLRFDSPLAFAGGQGERVVPGAVRILSEAAGPGRFGLDLSAGLVEARVDVRLARSRPDDGWSTRLLAMPVDLRARLALLTDAWNASGPYGEDADSVEIRVAAGARLPLLETAIDAGWLPVRGLLEIGATLGFESSARDVRWHDIDVDRVPPDRIGGPRPAGPAGAPSPVQQP